MPESAPAFAFADAPQPPWSRRAERATIAGFWAFLGALAIVRSAVSPRGPAGLVAPEVALAVAEYALWALVTPVVFWLAHRLPLEREGVGRRLVGHLALALAFAVVAQLLLGVLGDALIPRDGLPRRADGTPRLRPGPLGALARLWFLDELVIYLAVLAAGFARNYFVRLREREGEAVRLRAQLAEARLAALRMQLNPHFLFNALHAVSALVERDPQGARRIVARLSGLLRHVLDRGGVQEVPLRDELAFLRDYLDIQRVRFQGSLEVTEDVDPDALDALVPNLVLQPLVENAVEHGVSGLEEGVGRIALRARRTPGGLVLSVADNGPGLDAAATAAPRHRGSPGVGLTNTRARLDALYGAAAGLDLATAPGGGFVATVTLPYRPPERVPVGVAEGAPGEALTAAHA